MIYDGNFKSSFVLAAEYCLEEEKHMVESTQDKFYEKYIEQEKLK